VRIAFLGPAGTFSDEALRTAPEAEGAERVGLPSIFDVVMAVHRGEVDRALVPLENSLEGSVNATLDALAVETEDVRIAGELVHGVELCLVAREHVPLDALRSVASFPHASAQAARFLRTRVPGARVLPADSTAEAVRQVAEGEGPDAAIGTRAAAELYGCEILLAGIEDVTGNETRFGWLARSDAPAPDARGPWKTAVVFWGAGSEAPGWLVSCLSEFAFRGVNLVRIESRPRKQGLGRYMFFVDLEGREADAPVAEALAALEQRTERVRVLGTFAAA
jgi:prephenate dehydratase